MWIPAFAGKTGPVQPNPENEKALRLCRTRPRRLRSYPGARIILVDDVEYFSLALLNFFRGVKVPESRESGAK